MPYNVLRHAIFFWRIPSESSIHWIAQKKSSSTKRKYTWNVKRESYITLKQHRQLKFHYGIPWNLINLSLYTCITTRLSAFLSRIYCPYEWKEMVYHRRCDMLLYIACAYQCIFFWMHWSSLCCVMWVVLYMLLPWCPAAATTIHRNTMLQSKPTEW